MDAWLLALILAAQVVAAEGEPGGYLGGGAGFGVQGGFSAQADSRTPGAGQPGDFNARGESSRATSSASAAHAPAAAALADDPLTSDAMRNDARLVDVCFVDAECGWAVGDRGVIWHTANGGQSWQLQTSGVDCPLASVCFLDRNLGWVAGGATQPLTHTSTAVLLATTDGGRHWQPLDQPLLPMMRVVRFVNPGQGWALTAPTAVFSSSFFTTADGGRTWNAMTVGVGDSGATVAGAAGGGEGGGSSNTVPGGGDWLCGDYAGPSGGALAGRFGATALVRPREIGPAAAIFGLRNLRQMRLLPPAGGWLVGDGGLVLTTDNFGATWRTLLAPSLDSAADQFDFRAVTALGERVWIAGAPGTRIFYSSDGGRTWLSLPTGSTVPLHALQFIDERRGWAVGALGTILASEDGGRSWRRQRCGGVRAALLGLWAEGDDVPWELLADAAGNEGYLTAVVAICRRDVESPPDAGMHAESRLHEAVVAAGGSESAMAWQFPLRQSGLKPSAAQVLELWNRVNDGRGLPELRAYLVRQIRTWRPEVIVTHEAGGAADPLGQIIHDAVRQAVSDAADPTMFPEQQTAAGLEPWRVPRLYVALPPGERGPIQITPSQFAPRLGRSLAEAALTPRGLIEREVPPAPPTIAFRPIIVVSGEADAAAQRASGNTVASRDLFGGLALPAGGEARRLATALPLANLAALRQSAERRRNVQAFVERIDQTPEIGAQILGQTDELVTGLNDDSATHLLARLADRYTHGGQWASAAETNAAIAARYPRSPAAGRALKWLVQYCASAEAAHRAPRDVGAGVARPLQGRSTSTETRATRAKQAMQYGQQLARDFPELYGDPAVRFPLAAAARAQGDLRGAERLLGLTGRAADDSAWQACRAAEIWLQQPQLAPSKPLLRCVRAATKPRLDGQLDDEVWRRGQAAELASAQHDDEAWPAMVMLARDEEYLYLAARCRKAPGVDYRPTPGPRPRDAELDARDRVELLLDIDRDYAVAYRLSVDDRGFTHDACWNDASWDPRWFVAQSADEASWTIEAAIAWRDLVDAPPGPRDVWAVGLQRIVPGAGFQSWSEPAAAEVLPQGFGLLRFE